MLDVKDQTDIKQISQTVMPLLINSLASTGKVEIMKELADNGANFNNVGYRCRGPIHIAATNGDIEAVQFLINENVNLDFPDTYGKSALFYACIHRHGEVVDLLVEKGSTLIVSPKKLANILCQAGYDNDMEFIRLLGKCEIDFNTSNLDSRNIGHISACQGHIEILKYLALKTSFNFNIKDRRNQSTLDEIKSNQNIE